jgi:molybdopterin/thiamine biosynthesis adenylyltransferase
MITIVGAGALGSHVALFLRNLHYDLKVVDFDKVEQKNLRSQFHTKLGLRRNKAQALAQAMQGMFGTKVESVPHKLSEDNANTDAILQDSLLVIDCTDNIKTRQLIQGYCLHVDCRCLHGALSADGTFGRIMWAEEFTPDAEGEEGEATCEDGEALPFFALAASVMAGEVQSFLKTGKQRSFQVTPGCITRLS